MNELDLSADEDEEECRRWLARSVAATAAEEEVEEMEEEDESTLRAELGPESMVAR